MPKRTRDQANSEHTFRVLELIVNAFVQCFVAAMQSRGFWSFMVCAVLGYRGYQVLSVWNLTPTPSHKPAFVVGSNGSLLEQPGFDRVFPFLVTDRPEPDLPVLEHVDPEIPFRALKRAP